MKKILIIDPPSGWKYGFPKPYHNPNKLPLEEWLLQHGYPQHEIDKGMAQHCRWWESYEHEGPVY